MNKIPMTQATLNNLAKETSPYLLEHSTNPVNWYAWNDQAFEQAKDQNKMIFVSVGYSACHWCHVMRHESFENKEVAEILNENFISIKVDREERPDIDHLLQMTFQVMNGRGGGWPLSIFMTPDRKPFYSGTYFPLKSKYGMPGFVDVLNAIIKAYKTKLPQVQSQSTEIENFLVNITQPQEKNDISELPSINIVEGLSQFYDASYGGFGQAPKFPSETTLALLLHESAFINNSTGLKIVFKTLDAMINGGIYDQLGGGFHRYSVDEKWLVPHFEKMLYNQSLLTSVLLEAFRVSKNQLYLDKVKETLLYVIREMMTPEGGFYSSQNADSENTEGKFFVWNENELNFLEPNQQQIISEYYDITKKGNWEGKNILHVSMNVRDLSSKYSKSEDDILDIITKTKELLFKKREERIKPSTDTKIIASWNALMLKSFIKAYRVFSDPADKQLFLDISKQSMQFILSMIENNCIFRIHISDKKSIKGFLDDFQYTISALLDFYEITLDDRYYEQALSLYTYSLDHFYDPEHGGFFYSLHDHNTLITRYKEYLDSPLPSANAYAIENTLRMAFFADENANFYYDIAEKTLKQMKLTSDQDFMSLSTMVYVKQLFTNHFTELTYVYRLKNNQLQQFINQLWLPYRLQIDYDISSNNKGLNEKDFLKGKREINNEIALFICKNFACSKPLVDNDMILEYLRIIYPNMIIELK